MAACIFLCTSSLITWYLYEKFNSLRNHLISKACGLFSNYAVNVQDSKVYRNMEMTRERISFTFDPRDMLLSLQIGFSFVRAAVACAILERISGLEPSSEITASRHLKLVTVLNFCPFTFSFSLDSIGAVCHQFGLLRTDLHLIPCAGFVDTSTRASSSCSLKRVGDRRHHCLTPTVVLNHSPMLPVIWTTLVALSCSSSTVQTRYALILYFCTEAHKAACHTLSNAFLKSLKTWYIFC